MKRKIDPTLPSGKKIADLLPDILAGIGSQVGNHQGEAIFHFWCFVLGEKMASFTEMVSFKNGILTIKVKSATLYALLRQHEKGRLLKELQKKFQVNDIVFRIG